MDAQSVLKGKRTRNRENQSKRSSASFVIYKDLTDTCVSTHHSSQKAKDPVETHDMSTQTFGAPLCGCGCHRKDDGGAGSTDAEAHRLMTQEEVPSEYWEVIAERRHDALNDSLKENDELRDLIEKLNLEKSEASELACQADYFENMILLLTGEEGADASESGSSEAVQHSETNVSESADTHFTTDPDPEMIKTPTVKSDDRKLDVLPDESDPGGLEDQFKDIAETV